MLRRLPLLFLALAAILLFAAPVFAQPPDFGPSIYADGKAWATQGVTDLPPPNDHNADSFDKLFGFTNGAVGQLSVAEAAPGNKLYNGGRWDAYTATWQISDPPLVTSYAELVPYIESGALAITHDENYFECPLRPVKE